MYKSKIITVKLLFLFALLACGTTFSRHKSKNKTKTASIPVETLSRQESDLIHFFYRPITFSQDGISHYFKYMYNHPEYTNYLPYNLSHMIQFLDYGQQVQQNEAFAASVIKLFMQKIKACPYIEAESFLEFMPKFCTAIKPYLEKKEADFLGEVQKVLKDRLTNIFSKYFSYFQKNPDSFMDALAQQVAQQTNQNFTTQHVEVEHIKKDILRFIELCMNKLVWSSKDDVQTWYVCNRLAYESKMALDQNILCGVDCFDDLCWSLIHRFCYFVELSAPTLSVGFYDHVLNDVKSKSLLLTSIQEQEDLMISKRSHLNMMLQKNRDLAHGIKQDAEDRLFEQKLVHIA